MNFAQYHRIEIPEGRVKQITRKSDNLLLWKEKYINQTFLSINSDGTIYNNSLGYKDKCRVRSSGEETVASSSCTGFIPYKKGDILHLYPKYAANNTTNAINFADENFNTLGQVTAVSTKYGICAGTYASQWTAMMNNIAAQTGNITTLDISNIENAGEIAYVRITVPDKSVSQEYGVNSGADIIITVNEELIL